MKKTFISILTILLFLALPEQKLFCTISVQQSDSLSLNEIINMAISDHPAIRLAEESINNAEARIGFARSGYYPDADITASYSNLGPVTKLTIPNMGTFQLFPADNYSAAVNVREMIYDFGRTKQNVEIEKANKSFSKESLDQVRQKLSMLVINNYFTMVYLQKAIIIKSEQIGILNKHLEYITRMFETGSATEYQILSTRVKISNVESQKVDLEAALKSQQALLVSLIGDKRSVNPVVKTDLTTQIPAIAQDSIFNYAFRNRDELKLNREKASIAIMKEELTKLQNKPVLNFTASAGTKNGYVPNLGELRPNYVLGLGLKVPVFDGTRTKYNLLQSRSATTSVGIEAENIKRTVVNEISDARENMLAAGKKITQFTLQVEQAEKAFSLANVSFNSGVITNLDLLDASTAVSDSRLLLLKSRIDYAASVYRFRAALGERLYK